MNQVMTPIDETLNKRLNAPSEASEQARYNHGYKDGLVRAAEEVEIKAQFASFSANKALLEVKKTLATLLFDCETGNK